MDSKKNLFDLQNKIDKAFILSQKKSFNNSFVEDRRDDISTEIMSKADLRSQYSMLIDQYKSN